MLSREGHALTCWCMCYCAFLHLCVCFHKARPYKALTIIVLSIDIGAGVEAQDWAAFLRAGCGLTPTKFPKHRAPRTGGALVFWGWSWGGGVV